MPFLFSDSVQPNRKQIRIEVIATSVFENKL